MTTSQSSHAAFSLVELSIVLTVVALLAGGILAGQSMIRAAKLRSVSTDAAMYKNALGAFKEKYKFYPGDMPTAGNVWYVADGALADGVDSDCADLTTQSTDALTCNGDGSGFIADFPLSSSRDQWYEAYRAWQQLGSEGMVKGFFGGVSENGRDKFNALPGVNVPPTRLDKRGVWTLRAFNYDFTSSGEWFDTPMGNFLLIGSNVNGGDGFNGMDPIMRPEEAFRVDTKMDDGQPATGYVTTLKGDGTINPGCTVDGSSTTAYDADNTEVSCTMIFRIDGNVY